MAHERKNTQQLKYVRDTVFVNRGRGRYSGNMGGLGLLLLSGVHPLRIPPALGDAEGQILMNPAALTAGRILLCAHVLTEADSESFVATTVQCQDTELFLISPAEELHKLPGPSVK